MMPSDKGCFNFSFFSFNHIHRSYLPRNKKFRKPSRLCLICFCIPNSIPTIWHFILIGYNRVSQCITKSYRKFIPHSCIAIKIYHDEIPISINKPLIPWMFQRWVCFYRLFICKAKIYSFIIRENPYFGFKLWLWFVIWINGYKITYWLSILPCLLYTSPSPRD